MSLPEPHAKKRIPDVHRPIVTVAVFGGGVALLAAISGLVILGVTDEADAQIASTGLATIGATLAGAFAGWMSGSARGSVRKDDDA